jgi:putative addiction module killer protein
VLPYGVLELRYYLTAGGESPFQGWFDDLDAAAAAKVTVALARLGQGNTSNAKTVGEAVLEYRIDWGPGYRVYFGRDGDTLVILLTGGTKQRQQRDIGRAKELWADYKRRRKPSAR